MILWKEESEEAGTGWEGPAASRERHCPQRMKRIREESGGGVRAGELTLEERLREYPELRARFEEMLAILENAAGDIVKADEVEQRVIEELLNLPVSSCPQALPYISH